MQNMYPAPHRDMPCSVIECARTVRGFYQSAGFCGEHMQRNRDFVYEFEMDRLALARALEDKLYMSDSDFDKLDGAKRGT